MKEAHKKKGVLLRRICLLYVNNSTLIPFFCSSSYRTAQIVFIKNPLFLLPFGC